MKKALVLILLAPMLCVMIAGAIIGTALATCQDASAAGGDLDATYEAAGSLGGVMGTGVTKSEILNARKHPLGGTALVEHQYRTTAYAPAAGGINCDSNGSCKSTASGIAVNGGSRKVYIVASNPRMNKYGALAYIWPNPYKWTGPFVVADTGGNFDGSDGQYRVDFYIWGDKDESFSNKWGNARMVQVSKTPLVNPQGVPAQGAGHARQIASTTVATSGDEKFRRPTSGPFTSGFGQRWGRLHAGVDIAPPAGTPIVAALSGRVIYAGWMDGYGNYTCIRHSQNMTNCYGHQQAFAKGVRVGKLVQQSQLIGYVGSTGHSTGPHLHFEVRLGPDVTSRPVDPMPYLKGSESVIPSDGTTADQAESSAACAGTADEGAPQGEGLAGIKAAAEYLDQRKYPYCYGGGHGSTPAKASNGQGGCTHSSGSDNGPGPGLDCSSSVSFVLQHAGIKVATMTSGGFMSWGKPGPGEHVTIWANDEHVFMVIDGRTFQTSVTNYRSGPGWTPTRSTAGFTPRHPVGL